MSGVMIFSAKHSDFDKAVEAVKEQFNAWAARNFSLEITAIQTTHVAYDLSTDHFYSLAVAYK